MVALNRPRLIRAEIKSFMLLLELPGTTFRIAWCQYTIFHFVPISGAKEGRIMKTFEDIEYKEIQWINFTREMCK